MTKINIPYFLNGKTIRLKISEKFRFSMIYIHVPNLHIILKTTLSIRTRLLQAVYAKTRNLPKHQEEEETPSNRNNKITSN